MNDNDRQRILIVFPYAWAHKPKHIPKYPFSLGLPAEHVEPDLDSRMTAIADQMQRDFPSLAFTATVSNSNSYNKLHEVYPRLVIELRREQDSENKIPIIMLVMGGSQYSPGDHVGTRMPDTEKLQQKLGELISKETW